MIPEGSDERKMRKTEFPRPRMSEKWEKQSFRGLGWAENEKNRVSEASDERKTRKTVLPRARMSGKLRFFDENSRRELRNCRFLMKIAVGSSETAGFWQKSPSGAQKLQVFDRNRRRELRNCRFLTEIAVRNIKIAVFQQNSLSGANKSLNRFLTDFCCLWSRLSGQNVINHAPYACRQIPILSRLIEDTQLKGMFLFETKSKPHVGYTYL